MHVALEPSFLPYTSLHVSLYSRSLTTLWSLMHGKEPLSPAPKTHGSRSGHEGGFLAPGSSHMWTSSPVFPHCPNSSSLTDFNLLFNSKPVQEPSEETSLTPLPPPPSSDDASPHTAPRMQQEPPSTHTVCFWSMPCWADDINYKGLVYLPIPNKWYRAWHIKGIHTYLLNPNSADTTCVTLDNYSISWNLSWLILKTELWSG